MRFKVSCTSCLASLIEPDPSRFKISGPPGFRIPPTRSLRFDRFLRPPETRLMLLPSETDPDRDNGVYLDLIEKQTQQMRELGFMGSPGRVALLETEARWESRFLGSWKQSQRCADSLVIKATPIQSNPNSGQP